MLKDVWFRDFNDNVVHIEAQTLSHWPVTARLLALMMTGFLMGAVLFTATSL